MTQVKPYFKLTFKISLVVIILIWLSRTDKIDFADLVTYFENPWLSFILLCTWFFGIMIIGTLRWFVLSKMLNSNANFYDLFKINMLANFFSSALPGVLASDFIRLYYLKTQDPKSDKTSILLGLFLDRLTGVTGLFLNGCISIGILNHLQQNAIPTIFSYISVGLFFALVIFIFLFLTYTKSIYSLLLNKISFLNSNSSFNKLESRLLNIQHKYWTVFIACILSAIMQLFCLILFAAIYSALTGSQNYFLVAALFPLGILVTMIPFLPGGLGLGHLGFEGLFRQFTLGANIGANVFNIYIFGLMACFIIFGIPAYLSYRKS